MIRKPIRKTVYRGYSTVGKKGGNKLYDIDLVKQDLLNHFNIKKTERFKISEYGSAIQDMLFEHMTHSNLERIVTETLRIISTDDRVTVINYNIIEGEYSFQMDCDLYYIGLDVQDTFKLLFDARNQLVSETEE